MRKTWRSFLERLSCWHIFKSCTRWDPERNIHRRQHRNYRKVPRGPQQHSKNKGNPLTMANRKNSKTIQGQRKERKMLKWKGNNPCKQRWQGLRKNHKRESQNKGKDEWKPSRRQEKQRNNWSHTHPTDNNQGNQKKKKKTGVYGFPRCNQSLWQGLARCNHVCHTQRRTKHPRMEHSQETERKPQSKNPHQIWRNKSNQHQRQYKTARSPIMPAILPDAPARPWTLKMLHLFR